MAVSYPLASSPLEEFSAKEIQRYLYLRTGMLAKGMNPDDPAVIPKLYEGTFPRKMPVARPNERQIGKCTRERLNGVSNL